MRLKLLVPDLGSDDEQGHHNGQQAEIEQSLTNASPLASVALGVTKEEANEVNGQLSEVLTYSANDLHS